MRKSKISKIKESLDQSILELQSNLNTVERKIDQVQQNSATRIEGPATIEKFDQAANILQTKLENIEDKLTQIQIHSSATLDEKIKLRIAFKQSQEQDEQKSELAKVSDKLANLLTQQSPTRGCDHDQSVEVMKSEVAK